MSSTAPLPIICTVRSVSKPSLSTLARAAFVKMADTATPTPKRRLQHPVHPLGEPEPGRIFVTAVASPGARSAWRDDLLDLQARPSSAKRGDFPVSANMYPCLWPSEWTTGLHVASLVLL
jgi:hypothetical protein